MLPGGGCRFAVVRQRAGKDRKVGDSMSDCRHMKTVGGNAPGAWRLTEAAYRQGQGPSKMARGSGKGKAEKRQLPSSEFALHQ